MSSEMSALNMAPMGDESKKVPPSPYLVVEGHGALSKGTHPELLKKTSAHACRSLSRTM
jgi:hypothetical protein